MVNKVIVTSCGGPASYNVVSNLKLTDDCLYLIGTDTDKYLIQLSNVDEPHVVNSAANEEDYICDLKELINENNPVLLIPQSDREVSVVSKNRYRLCKTVLPSDDIISICQDKGKLYEFLQFEGIRVPPFKNPTNEDIHLMLVESPNYGFWLNWYPCWIRSRTGAGGNKSFVANTWRDFKYMAMFYREREHVDWQLVKQLKGRNYSWTSLWNNGELITSVLKERLEWVYNRIGTTAVNCTVNDLEVNKYCESIVNVLRDKFDSKLSGIMMIDLMEDIDDGKFYVTECNAGRLGTVNYNYGLWSREVFGDDRLNFPYLLYKIAIDEVLPYPFKKFDPLPPDIYYIRHIDMGYKNIYP